MKEGVSSNSTTSISQARKAVEQLKMEACMDRVKMLPVAEEPLVRHREEEAELPQATPDRPLACEATGMVDEKAHTVSQAAADLLAYCEAHVREDPLIIPVPASENPFREKKFFCTIL
ncbi:Guanine nucleotide-binding protein G(I)/G(S)/G(O) subunit gamma-4 [Pteropus alecto]|uniref:Guanine nucleotide-binding protein G(I)/G(S)/G(O) subunit gamma-4 n=1 Tax=Pteropus alecto TaxID=9402 RepID=L5K3P3_PTEAL|nr:Guanine nucleotide-binding protein G(I)/G(S)/G(O) subunit gamma-4 [Pteropus alecto]